MTVEDSAAANSAATLVLVVDSKAAANSVVTLAPVVDSKAVASPMVTLVLAVGSKVAANSVAAPVEAHAAVDRIAVVVPTAADIASRSGSFPLRSTAGGPKRRQTQVASRFFRRLC